MKPLSNCVLSNLLSGFNCRFNLTDKKGAVTELGAFAVRVKRPSGRIELSFSLKASKSR